jgi:hypothetical protein
MYIILEYFSLIPGNFTHPKYLCTSELLPEHSKAHHKHEGTTADVELTGRW